MPKFILEMEALGTAYNGVLSENMEFIRKLGVQAKTDHLTGVGNRAAFESYTKYLQNNNKEVIIFIFDVNRMYAILKTGSRGGLIGVVFGAAAYIAIGIKSFKTRAAIFISAILSAILIIFIVFPLLPDSVQERYTIESVKEDKGSGRFEIWEYLMEYTLDKPERIIKGSGVLLTYQILRDSDWFVRTAVFTRMMKILTFQELLIHFLTGL